MEHLKLVDGTTYEVISNGFNITPGLCIIQIKTELSLEQIFKTFSDKSLTKILTLSDEKGRVTQIATGFTRLNPTLRKTYGMEIIPATQKTVEKPMLDEFGAPVLDEDGKQVMSAESVDVPAVFGDVVEVILEQAGLSEQVDQNSADIDYLAIMSNVEL